MLSKQHLLTETSLCPVPGNYTSIDRAPAWFRAELPGLLTDLLVDNLQDIKRRALAQQQLDDFEECVKVQDQTADMGITYVTTAPDGSRVVQKAIFEKAPDYLTTLLNRPDPWLMTGLQWNHLALEARIEICTSKGLSSDAVLSSDIHEVFPEDTDQFLIEWQRAVNSGDAFNCSVRFGSLATSLIDAGYLLMGPEAVTGNWHNLPSRHDVIAGAPGSPAFVRAHMGDTYLSWIEAVR